MLMLYTLFHALPNGAFAVDTSSALESAIDGSSSCDNIHGCRTVGSIVWTCISVVFICTWVAIHPNVPRHGSSTADVFLDNASIMIMALIAPELIVLWAMRQWFSARDIAKQFNKYGWGKTHAFFILMGGFAFYDNDRFCYTLWDSWNVDKSGADRALCKELQYPAHEDHDEPSPVDSEAEHLCLLECLVRNRYITVTEEEIQDRSHADVLSKGIAIVQTGWFVLQCIARAIQGLAITELEVITLAFAFLNFITYFLWWNKPHRVRYPVRVEYRRPSRMPPQLTELPTKSVQMGSERRLESGKVEPDSRGTVRAVLGFLRAIPRIFFRYALRVLWYIVRFTGVALYYTCLVLVYTMAIIIQFLRGKEDDRSNFLFSSRLKGNPPHPYIACYLIAIVFGALHCIAWSFEFTTKFERFQWRMLSLVVTLLPMEIGLFHALWERRIAFSEFIESSGWIQLALQPFVMMVFMAGPLSVVAYIVARIWLIVLAFVSLRNLPPSAYEAVRWTLFVPHIG